MKSYISLFIVVVAVLAVGVNSAAVSGIEEECPNVCTFDYRPICGYDGKCYNIYSNSCGLRSARCQNKQANIETVDMKLCDEAQAKTNPNVVACSNQ